ncbi:helix-turn-helix domain-containing protein [Hymenobacter sp. 15J16-1T3B]|uniref:helix-turn-helix transcriptional regulator n=1 Tax=Hymenobacter sp. 15J16-1T3B TaxID=2886941 RepID=UPI001D123600|nr:helix-turn-helix domain-containing protein [Hymenobacter sp. 15J16-1T3B]MCC3160671.1 helix-turn-helix domain-containing protein [Hymenobacter sp. 15J16-1T3B]
MMYSALEAPRVASLPPLRFAPHTLPAVEPPHGQPAAEVVELHRHADFLLRWQALPSTRRPPLYLVFMVTEGEGLHRIGGETFYVRDQALCFLGPAALATWQPGPAARQGYFCAFTEAFLLADREDKTLLRSLPFFAGPSAATALTLPAEAGRYFLELFEHMADDAQAEPAEAAPLLRAQLSLLLLRAAFFYREGLPAGPLHSAGQRLTAAFLALLEEDLAPARAGEPVRQGSIRAYARRLGVSQNHLNDAVRRHTGRSAGTLAHDALARAAAELLARDGRPVHALARLLGFASATYFARFFRLRTGYSPSQQRRHLNRETA